MSLKLLRLYHRARNAIVALLIIAGAGLWSWADVSNDERFFGAISGSFASDIVREHLRTSPDTVRGYSEMTAEQIRAVYPNVNAQSQVDLGAELHRVRFLILAQVAAVCCWFIGSMFVLLGQGPRRGRIAGSREWAAMETMTAASSSSKSESGNLATARPRRTIPRFVTPPPSQTPGNRTSSHESIEKR